MDNANSTGIINPSRINNLQHAVRLKKTAAGTAGFYLDYAASR